MRKKKPNLSLLAQGINGIAEMFVELSARLDRMESELAALRVQNAAACANGAETEAEKLMWEYCYGRGDEDE